VPIALRCDGFTLRRRFFSAVARRACRISLLALLLISGCGTFPQPSEPVPIPDVSVFEPGAQDGPTDSGPVGAARPARQLDGSLHGRTGAHLTLGSAAAAVDLRLAVLPGLLYRIRTPGDSGLTPRVTGRPGFIDLRLTPTGEDGPDRVNILLNRDVVWQVRMSAGAGEQRLDLSGGRFSGVVLGGGAGLVRLRLPRPYGTTRIRLAVAGPGAVHGADRPGLGGRHRPVRHRQPFHPREAHRVRLVTR
jgi:hypothetical protein